MAFCSECGSTLPDGARFCPKCGTETRGTEAPAGFAAAPQSVRHPAPADAPSSAPGRKGFILPIAIVVAVALIGLLLWSQRDGTRPIAGPIAGNTSERAENSSGATAGAEDADVSDAPGEPAKEADEESDEPTNGTTIATAASLDSAFHSDPQGARDRYVGPVTVSGVVATMASPGPMPALSLEGRTRFNFVLANFPSDDRAELASVTKGDRVTVSCRGVNLVAGTTILQDCALE